MRVWLNVPYKEREDAKKHGARWDVARKRWYVENKENLEPFLRWIDERLKRPVKTR